MRSQTAYLVVMMVMMGCFAIFRLDERQLVLAPGNLAVTGSLILGAVVVWLNRPYSLAVGLCSAGFTAAMGVVALANHPHGSHYLRLPGYPLIWVIIGLYIAFRLVINQQHQKRQQQASSRATVADEEEDSTGGEG